jgi:hypothetical protein
MGRSHARTIFAGQLVAAASSAGGAGRRYRRDIGAEHWEALTIPAQVIVVHNSRDGLSLALAIPF